MVLVKPDSTSSMPLGNLASQSCCSNAKQAMRQAAQSMIETTRLQWAQPLVKVEERSVEERLLDAA
jgi:hypothetical protein